MHVVVGDQQGFFSMSNFLMRAISASRSSADGLARHLCPRNGGVAYVGLIVRVAIDFKHFVR